MRENFKPAGVVEYAAFCNNPPPFINSSPIPTLTKVQKSGIRYEKRAQDHLGKLCASSGIYTCVCNPWLMFRRQGELSSNVNFCQPDVLLISRTDRKIIIGEIKVSHTADSWRQLRQLYEPVLRRIYSQQTEFCFLEICKWLDPHTSFPETFYYAENVLDAETNRIGVHIYKPRGRG